MSDDGKRWTAYPAEEQIWRNDRVYYVSCDGPATLLRDIAARLNGPSPAEVAALLRESEWAFTHAMTGEMMCWCCCATKAEGHADCKLDAMIKQCEGA